ncbi:MAG: tRNA-dihydrouridine synthase family protein [Kiritimatiellae bacterium]|nr:tRNA-dihydrouridine synthase family protein [Kiritimatiellia bacterium]
MLILAPLRGVTINAFRRAFASQISAAGFTAAIAPFIPANPGIKVRDAFLKEVLPFEAGLTPQVITRDPTSMRILLRAFKEHGYTTADLNAGCPFPMIVKRGRGSGLIRTPALFEELVRVGVEEMGEGNFSVKTRLGVSSPREIEQILPILAKYPLRFATIHGRTAREMYSGACNKTALGEIARTAPFKVVLNGDFSVSDAPVYGDIMVGRSFVRSLGTLADSSALLAGYMDLSRSELSGDGPVLGRMKELVLYWTETSQRWKRLWPVLKIARTVREFASALPA